MSRNNEAYSFDSKSSAESKLNAANKHGIWIFKEFDGKKTVEKIRTVNESEINENSYVDQDKEETLAKSKSMKLDPDYTKLKKQIKDKMKENSVLKYCLREVEEMLNRKENHENIIELIKRINVSTNADLMMKSLNSRVLNLLHNKDPIRKSKQTKNIVVVTIPNINDKREQELKNTIQTLNSRIERYVRETRSLKEELAKTRNEHNSLAAIFEDCLNYYKENLISSGFYTINNKKHSEQLKDEDIFDSLSAEDKEEIFRTFLRNDLVLNKLREIVISQFSLPGKVRATNTKKPIASSITLTEKAYKNSSRTNETSMEYSRGRRIPNIIQVKTANIVFQGKSLPRIITKERNDNINLPFFQLKKYV